MVLVVGRAAVVGEMLFSVILLVTIDFAFTRRGDMGRTGNVTDSMGPSFGGTRRLVGKTLAGPRAGSSTTA